MITILRAGCARQVLHISLQDILIGHRCTLSWVGGLALTLPLAEEITSRASVSDTHDTAVDLLNAPSFGHSSEGQAARMKDGPAVGDGPIWAQSDGPNERSDDDQRRDILGRHLGLVVPCGLVLLLHVRKDDGEEEACKHPGEVPNEIHIGRDGGHHDAACNHESEPQEHPGAALTQQVPCQENLCCPHSQKPEATGRRSHRQLHWVGSYGDQVAKEATEHVEEAELPPPELLLHPKADAHLEEEVEEDVQCICMQHHR